VNEVTIIEPRDTDAFRSRIRTWLRTNLVVEPRPVDFRERWERTRAWQQKLSAAGWVALSYPVEYGGQGLGVVEEAILSEELARAGAPPMLPLGHLGRPLLTHGTDAQRQRYLRKLLSAEEIWCQGFSEPTAGSDLASLRTRATKVEGGYVITGQKMWTSYGVFADMALVLARTGEVEERHRGISAFLVPLTLPGITVRPIVLANGDEEFAEVFLDDVVVGDDSLLGEIGQGWEIAMTTIGYERGAVDTGYQIVFAGFVNELARELSATSRVDDSYVLRELGKAITLVEVMGLQCLRAVGDRASGGAPGPEASIDKLLMTTVEQQLLATALEISGSVTDPLTTKWFDRYLYGRAASIYGGSSQIQKNILATRMLGLPRSRP
jgi:alkylation response protein AidB-like acyl-CoA dehydrogenase